MYRAPVRPQRSPGAPRPAGRFPSPASCWGSPGTRSPYEGFGHRGGSPGGCPPYSPRSPRGYRGGSPAGFGSGSRGFAGHLRGRGDGSRRPPSVSPTAARRFQLASDASAEKYFSPSMIQDPWETMQPVSAAAAAARRTM